MAYSVRPDDAADLAQQILGLLRDPGRMQELGRRGREGVHDRFTAAHMAERVERILRDSVLSAAA